MFQALSVGLVAALIGAALYFGVAAITGYEIGLVAIVLGLIVGGAVRLGSGGRGGWFYQLMAIGLTYLSIGAADFSMILKEYATNPEWRATLDREGHAKDAGPAAPRPESTVAEAESVDATAAEEAGRPVSGFIPAALTFVVMIASLPVLIGMQSPITFLFIGFAVYEAWKINKGRAVTISGPFAITSAVTSAVTSASRAHAASIPPPGAPPRG